ncbi:MAG: hypothetical protein M3220_02880 [Chloroflexota bacterium]|nr:hypothetical protein [Chloroflexota bacterium]
MADEYKLSVTERERERIIQGLKALWDKTQDPAEKRGIQHLIDRIEIQGKVTRRRRWQFRR